MAAQQEEVPNRKKIFNAVKKLSESMKLDGHELAIFRFVLGPVFRGETLPKNKTLHELYQDKLNRKFGTKDGQALAHLWYGVDAIGDQNDTLSNLFEAKLVISNQDVRFRRLLAEVATRLAQDVSKSKNFIRYVVDTEKLEQPAENFMPPEEKEGNANVFVPCIIKLFTEAEEEECDIRSKLKQWLDECTLKKISRHVAKFNPEEIFRKEFTICIETPLQKLHAECSEEDNQRPRVSSDGKEYKGKLPSSNGTASKETDSVMSYDSKFQVARQESRDEVGQANNELAVSPSSIHKN